MFRLLCTALFAFACVLPVALSAEEELEGSHEGVDLYKVTHYDKDGVSYQVDFYAENKNPHDVIIKLDMKEVKGLRANYDEEGAFVSSGEKRKVVSFVLLEEGGSGNYEFDWYVMPDYEYFQQMPKK
ncbi:MAG: hypothetical protein KDK78_11845 [Chlamydiia bacterium]|nr:hypothetical protein [Chlamydiia bacterium]